MADATCTVDDCPKRATRRGWCPKHYERWRRHGSPTAGGDRPSPGEPMAWLSALVAAPPTDSCVTTWPYATAGANHYPQIWFERGRTSRAMAVLTFDEVEQIRRRRAEGERGKDLAAEYGVSQQAICDIHKGRNWRAA